MNDLNRRRRKAALGADLLESRQLLNAHLPQSPVAHVASVHAEAKKAKPITGTWTATSRTMDPRPPYDVFFTEKASGGSSVGSVALDRSYVLHSPTFKPKEVPKQTILDGTGTLTLGDGSKLSLQFTGTALVRQQTTTYSIKGTATAESGPDQGRVYTLTATATSSPHMKRPFPTYRFTLK